MNKKVLIREIIEKQEKEYLSKYGTLSINSKGRMKDEPLCNVRTIYMQDRDRILHSEYFRRLKHKTQVFLSPAGMESYRTRLTHTLEVSQIARTIARALRVNEDLTEAIALGHDLGHTPFGHAGEDVLNRLYKKGFKHAHQSLRVVDKLEKPGGMNLSYEVRDGIVKHSKGGKKLLPYDEPDCPNTIEGEIVRVCDSIAYINHDIDDALKAGVITLDEFPKSSIENLGTRHSERIGTMVNDIIENSIDKPHIFMSKKLLVETEKLRNFLFSDVYTRDSIEIPSRQAGDMLEEMFLYFKEHPELPIKEMSRVENDLNDIDVIIVDFLSRLTDNESLALYIELFGKKEKFNSLFESLQSNFLF